MNTSIPTHRILPVFIGLLALATAAAAEVTLPNVFGSGMVLQRGRPVPVWGWAEAGEKVEVAFAGQTRSVQAGADGKWMVKLGPLKASREAAKLTVRGANQLVLDNVLVGEVWICSGQSNMEWGLGRSLNAKAEVAAANHPHIRLFNVPGHTTSPVPVEKGAGKWQVCLPDAARGFSAVGYFFGRRLHEELEVPIGLVGANWGGTRIEPWTTLAGFESVPELSDIAEQVKAYQPGGKVGHKSPSAIYRSMVHPLAPFAMRGAIWYQGEANGGEGVSYYHKTHALVNGWRKAFQNPDLGFYWVQLANFQKENPNPEGGDGWAKIREAQTRALDIPHTGMAVITDIGAANDIHPKNKQDVGGRLAQWALHQTYGKKDLVPSGPLYKNHRVEGGAIRVAFNHAGKGLVAGKKQGLEPVAEVKDGKLEHFAISGTDGKWHWAEAVIDGDTVVVKSPEVSSPAAVRYAFAMNPAKANLYNRDGFPAGPFRTDGPRDAGDQLKWHPVIDSLPLNSEEGGAPVTIQFQNRSGKTVKIFWIPYGGGLKEYGALEAGATRNQTTYSKANWLITDENERHLGYFTTTAKGKTAVIPKN